ncbi:amidohydrolase family protein [Phenylobacterium sp. LjRoot225]|uniref:amidohydrolase family protein n=1 Tax=Phenylobacterium sp. LjRoot225 TaxID=3342285 RepID=UPI003ECED74F
MEDRDLILRNVEVAGRPGQDVRLARGRIAEIGERLCGPGDSLDGRGGALLPGLVDHHIHLLASAARAQSALLERSRDAVEFERTLREALAARPAGAWLRATGYHERMAGDLDRDVLDRIAPGHRLRVQHQTGSLWILNSLALEKVTAQGAPPEAERDAAGRLTGRIWRGDAWLRARLANDPPDLSALGKTLTAHGITGLTDASATTDGQAAGLLAQAHRLGVLPQRLTLMSAGPLAAPEDGAFEVGPVKVLLDDARLLDLAAFVERIVEARPQGRAVAVHCVTAGELALTLAAFEIAGARPGDRVEHGGVIPADAIPVLKQLGLTVVTQPAFVFERGDRYLAEVDPAEQGDLYRCASLLAAGVPTAASSDAPYASPDPWSGIRAAIRRRTRDGQPIGTAEQVGPMTALNLYLGERRAPGGQATSIAPGAAADLCLLSAPLAEILAEPSAERVRATIVAGRVVFAAN